MKNVMRFAVCVHFSDERAPRWGIKGNGTMGTASSVDGATMWRNRAGAEKFAEECGKTWGSQAEVGVVAVDAAPAMRRRLERLEEEAAELRSELG